MIEYPDDYEFSHTVTVHETRYLFRDGVEVYCEEWDEPKVILGKRYVNNCPMCGREIDV